MKVEIAKKWAEALRSGKYRQGIGELRARDGTYCCLGVLCDLYEQEVGGLGWEPAYDNGGNLVGYDVGGESSVLPEKVVKWADTAFNPRLDPGGGRSEKEATHLNDAWKLSFSEIADAVERTYIEGKEESE